MAVKPSHVFAVAVAALALAFVAMAVMHIGAVFEEKSLNSYLLKSGDTDAGSPAASAHIHGMAAHGRRVAMGVALGGLCSDCSPARSRHDGGCEARAGTRPDPAVKWLRSAIRPRNPRLPRAS